jgi:dTMP kinase
VVISDRYVASGLVMQRFDDIDLSFLWQLNARADQPDLAIILEADPVTISERLAERGPHNRFQRLASSSYAEVDFYHQASEHLKKAGFDVFIVDCNQRQPEQAAACIHNRLTALFATPK